MLPMADSRTDLQKLIDATSSLQEHLQAAIKKLQEKEENKEQQPSKDLIYCGTVG